MILKTIAENVGANLILLAKAFRYLPCVGGQCHRVLEQCFLIGYQTFPIVGILSFFLGAILALQVGLSVQFAGSQGIIGPIVGLAMARELAPLITAFLLAGRVGSAITAEISSMKVYQEVDALRTMNIPPEKILVMPRLVAIAIMMPVLVICATFIGWWGGSVIAMHVPAIDIEASAYWRDLRGENGVGFEDVLNGLIKGEIFGLIVVLIACTRGMVTSGGPRQIGFAVTEAVVTAMFAVLLIDYVLTRILL